MYKVKSLEAMGAHPKLAQVCYWMQENGFNDDEFDIITSFYRDNDSGVHHYHRAIDLRCHDAAKGLAAQDTINAAWVYDPTRPKLKVAIYHDVGQGVHLHIQVHDNTTFKDILKKAVKE